MQSAKLIDLHDSVQQKILDVALLRFRHYGYNKTTMAEIATDSGMSAANLYRYFDNKQEIGASCVERCISERLDHIRQRVNQNGLNAKDKLRTLTMATLNYCHKTYSTDAKINDLFSFIADEKPEIAHNKFRLLQKEIQCILEYGNQTGEFEVKDTNTTARSIYCSIILFDTPVFIGFYSLEKFEELANEVIDLILNGLTKR